MNPSIADTVSSQHAESIDHLNFMITLARASKRECIHFSEYYDQIDNTYNFLLGRLQYNIPGVLKYSKSTFASTGKVVKVNLFH